MNVIGQTRWSPSIKEIETKWKNHNIEDLPYETLEKYAWLRKAELADGWSLVLKKKESVK